MTIPAAPTETVLLLPVYNDWESLAVLLGRINHLATGSFGPVTVVIVDDGSVEPWPFPTAHLKAVPDGIRSIRVIRLRGNLGHQRAIAIGLTHLAVEWRCMQVVVMDSDGEDDPAHIPLLLERSRAECQRGVVFAGRTRRTERFAFRIGYFIYQQLQRVLTGVQVRVGNYSVIPFPVLSRLVIQSDMWNHYAATVMKSRTPFFVEGCPRAARIAGRPHMNYTGLVVHGLSAISVFAERVGVRLLTASLGIIVAMTLTALGVVGIRFLTDWAIPGWATTAFAMAINILLTAVGLASVFALITLGSRGTSGFLPIRDYSYFIESIRDHSPPADE